MVRAIAEGPGGHSSRSVLAIGATALALAALYLLFAGSVGLNEGIACVISAGLGTVWARRAGRIGDPTFRPRPRMLRPVARAVASLPLETLRTGRDLTRAILGGRGGAIEARPVGTISRHPASDTSPEAQADRAIGVFAASLAPRSYVLRLDGEGGQVAVHTSEPCGTRGGAA